MTTFRIPKSWHHSLPPSIGVFRKRRSFRKAVVFHSSWRQAPDGIDYWDVNKIFGVAFFTPKDLLLYFLSVGPAWIARRFGSTWKPKPPHHVDSARFGGRYDTVNDKVSIYAYSYVNGERITKHITCVPINRVVYMDLLVETGRRYWFGVKQPNNPFYTAASYYEPFTHKKKWAYALWPYYGGTSTPASDIIIRLKNLPHD
jgi:hypothetical protein